MKSSHLGDNLARVLSPRIMYAELLRGCSGATLVLPDRADEDDVQAHERSGGHKRQAVYGRAAVWFPVVQCAARAERRVDFTNLFATQRIHRYMPHIQIKRQNEHGSRSLKGWEIYLSVLEADCTPKRAVLKSVKAAYCKHMLVAITGNNKCGGGSS